LSVVCCLLFVICLLGPLGPFGPGPIFGPIRGGRSLIPCTVLLYARKLAHTLSECCKLRIRVCQCPRELRLNHGVQHVVDAHVCCAELATAAPGLWPRATTGQESSNRPKTNNNPKLIQK